MVPVPGYDPIPDKGYLVEEIAGGLYWVTEGSYQALFMETRRGVVVVDAPPTLAAALPAAIAEVTSKPVTHFIYSHSHGDHVGVAGARSSPHRRVRPGRGGSAIRRRLAHAVVRHLGAGHPAAQLGVALP